jgi:hypothetical protein
VAAADGVTLGLSFGVVLALALVDAFALALALALGAPRAGAACPFWAKTSGSEAARTSAPRPANLPSLMGVYLK